MAALEKRLAHDREVVQLAILRGDDGAILIGQGLPAAGYVDDAEARGADGEPVAGDDVQIVRPAMMESAEHGRHRGALAVAEESGYAAHERLLICGRVAARNGALVHR